MKTMAGKIERQNPQRSNNQSDSSLLSRRGFMQTGVVVGTALLMPPVLGNVLEAQAAVPGPDNSQQPILTTRRTLGSGKYGFEVSTLGFGVMGMNYNRGPHPERKAMITLL